MITSNTLGHSPAWLDDGRLKDLDINLPVVHLVSHRVWGSERDQDSKTKCSEPTACSSKQVKMEDDGS